MKYSRHCRHVIYRWWLWGYHLTKTVQSGGAQHSQYLKSCILKIGWFVVLKHILYQFHIWSSVVRPIERGILKDFVCEYVLWHKLVIPKYHKSCLHELIFQVYIFFSFNKLFTIFCAVVMLLLMVIYRNKYKSIYPLYGE